MRTSLKDYFHALNVLSKEVDVSIDGTDACIAVCPPIRLASKGEEKFAKILDNQELYVDVEEYGNCIMCDNDDAFEQYEEGYGMLEDARIFIYSLAGYCPSNKFEEWFEGSDAKLI